jgi:hypothetical protein
MSCTSRQSINKCIVPLLNVDDWGGPQNRSHSISKITPKSMPKSTVQNSNQNNGCVRFHGCRIVHLHSTYKGFIMNNLSRHNSPRAHRVDNDDCPFEFCPQVQGKCVYHMHWRASMCTCQPQQGNALRWSHGYRRPLRKTFQGGD